MKRGPNGYTLWVHFGYTLMIDDDRQTDDDGADVEEMERLLTRMMGRDDLAMMTIKAYIMVEVEIDRLLSDQLMVPEALEKVPLGFLQKFAFLQALGQVIRSEDRQLVA